MGNKKTIYIIGMGPGSDNLLTDEACIALAKAEYIIGAERLVKDCPYHETKPCFYSYKLDEIASSICRHSEFNEIALVYSGDIGFYSGAKNIQDKIIEYVNGAGLNESDYSFVRIPGVSSVIYLMDRINKSWDDAMLVSNHGRSVNLISLIRDNKKVCTLLGEKDTVSKVCEKLVAYGLGDVAVTVGERLSYEDECITKALAKDMVDKCFDKLAVAYFENENIRKNRYSFGMPDDAFVRGNVPMTKQEIRTVSLSKLMLKKDSVVYDIGAGTGSVSVEAALIASEGKVYAIEKNSEAIKLLESNKIKHVVDNMEIIEGIAPTACESLEAPTHAFIGGSSGNLREIIEQLLAKNKNIRCVINAVTIETLARLEEITKSIPECADMELVQMSVSKGKKLGGYHLMSAENPVYIASFGGKEQ